MKNYEEMAREVLESRDRIIGERRAKRRKIERYSAGALCLCTLLIVTVGVFRNTDPSKPIDEPDTIVELTQPSTSSPTTVPAPTAVTTTITEAPTTAHSTESTTARTTTASSEVSSVTTQTTETSAETSSETSQSTATTTQTSLTSSQTTQTSTTTQTITTQTTEPEDSPPFEPEPGDWSTKPFYGKYQDAVFGNTLYYSWWLGISETKLGDCIGTALLSGYDNYGIVRETNASVYGIDGYGSDEAIAVKADDGSGYFLYLSSEISGQRRTEIYNNLR